MTPNRREALQARLEAIKELKAEYYVGSQDAFKYLKAMHYYEELHSELRKHFGASTPRLREIMALSRKLSFLIRSVLQFISIRFSTPEDLSISVGHVVRDNSISNGGNPHEDKECCYFWRLDMTQLLRSFFVVAEPLESLEGLTSTLISAFKNIPFLILEATGQRVLLRDIIENPELRRGTEGGFWTDCEGSYGWWEALGQEEDEEDFPTKDYERLGKALEARDLVSCHETFRQIKLRFLEKHWMGLDEEGVRWNNRDTGPFHVSPEETYYLLDEGKLFKRAEAEYTLGHFDVERRIALSFICNHSTGGNYRTVASLIDTAYKQALMRIDHYNDRLRTLEQLEAPSVVMKDAERLLRQAQYLKLVILQNKEWLRTFLSR